jgi:hypothetical protein
LPKMSTNSILFPLATMPKTPSNIQKCKCEEKRREETRENGIYYLHGRLPISSSKLRAWCSALRATNEPTNEPTNQRRPRGALTSKSPPRLQLYLYYFNCVYWIEFDENLDCLELNWKGIIGGLWFFLGGHRLGYNLWHYVCFFPYKKPL